MRRFIAALIATATLLLFACEKKAPRPGSETGAQGAALASGAVSLPQGASPAGDVILIGEVGSLTGAEATFGISTRNGIEMAVKEANAAGGVKGKKLLVRVYDDQGKPEEAANAVTRLISEKVKLILGEVASSNSLAMAPKAQQAGVPMITPSSTNPKVTAVGDYIFRVCFIDPFQGYVMARFARDKLKLANIAVLKDQKSDYSLGLSDVFINKFTEMGGKIVSTVAYAKGDTDFRAQLTAIKGTKPEAIYVPGYYTDVGIIARQARELGIKVPLLGGDGWESEKLFELGGSAVEGSYYTNHYSQDDPSPQVQKFIASYKSAYGAVPDSLGALGYDAARVGIQAMQRASDVSGPALRDAIAATRDFPAVAGTITLDRSRNAVKPAVVLKVVGGKTQFVTTVAP
ncbi:MAG TPA: ABC transporter substrate-binding protein [Polyangiaceae bacterium]|jgi:branched-chain amino acid transport system substrate-binding protein